MLPKAAKKRKCAGCKEYKIPAGCTSVIAWCSEECLKTISKTLAIKAKKTKASIERKQFTERKKAFNTSSLKWQIKQTQVAFNKMIRLLDQGKPCISCGKLVCGTEMHCGHFKSVAARPALRFDPRNAYLQGSDCNKGAARHALNEITVSQAYEITLRRLYGTKLVDYLNGFHPVKKYSIQELIELRQSFNLESSIIASRGVPTKDWRAL